MHYKVRFRPLERLGVDGWRRFTAGEQADLIESLSTLRRDDQPCIEGGGKDGTPGGQRQYRMA